MYTAQILDAQKDTYADGSPFLNIEVGVYSGKKKVDVRFFAMDIESSEKDITNMVKKFIKLYNQEAESAKVQAESKAKDEKVSKIISKVKGATIS